MRTEAFPLPDNEFEVRNSRFAGRPAGKVNRPMPVRAVVVSSVFTPESRPTR